MKPGFFLSLFLICSIPIYSQQLLRTKVLTVPGMSLNDCYSVEGHKACQTLVVDSSGNYLLRIRPRDGAPNEFYFNSTKLGELKHLTGSSGVDEFESMDGKGRYYTSSNGLVLNGPYTGECLSSYNYITSGNGVHLAIPILNKDTIYLFLDGKVLNRTDTFSQREMQFDNRQGSQLEAKKYEFHNNEWADLSDNGNLLYCIEQHKKYFLYLNKQKLDSSSDQIIKPLLNSRGQYLYATGNKTEKGRKGHYSYAFFLHTPSGVFGPVRTAWNNYLKEDGGYYFSGDDDGPEYLLVNGHLYLDINQTANLIIPDSKHFFFTFTPQDSSGIYTNASGQIRRINYEKIFCPALDESGNYSFIGLRNYYLYPCVNGVEGKAFTKYNIRPTPLYLSPDGKESWVCYKSSDSMHLFHNNNPEITLSTRNNPFFLLDLKELLHGQGGDHLLRPNFTLKYLQLKDSSYTIYNGTLARNPLPIRERGFGEEKPGEIISSEINESGFYYLQNLGKNKCFLNCNNKTFLITNLDGVLENSFTLTNHSLTFYANTGNDIYKYTYAFL